VPSGPGWHNVALPSPEQPDLRSVAEVVEMGKDCVEWLTVLEFEGIEYAVDVASRVFRALSQI
jgi:hypothetical protein